MTVEPYSLLDGLQALVIDHENDSLSLIIFMLVMYGVQVTAVDSAGAALKALEVIQPDFLICNTAVPFEDGNSLIRRIRALKGEDEEQVPAIALGVLSSETTLTQVTLQSSICEEFQACLTKPIEPEDLVAVVLNFVGKPHPA
ncbi:response regulator [Kovacikia minuta CCNUW1]|uniref:response regulator n=1 Tax=Kovacikia minuta TaxID=2931930 RepID=UPI001CCE5A97|nr:response regulator [Kovacikia minuta]UBF28188.1 response regulator [Kovacikia minuta CCNUW1]